MADPATPGPTHHGRSDLIGFVQLAIAALGYGFMSLLRGWAVDAGADTVTLLALRFSFAGLVLLSIALARRAPWPKGAMFWLACSMGAVLYVIEAGTYFFALKHIPSGLVALLLYLYPAPVAIASWLFFREKLGRARLLALILAMLGSAFTVIPALTGAAGGPPGGSPTLGVVLGVSCAIAYAVYMLVGGQVTKNNNALAVTTLVCLSAGIVFSIWATLADGWHLPQSPKGWAGIGLLSIFSTVIAILCVLAGLKRLGSVRASTISTLEAAATVAVGGIFLHERLTLIQFVGGALILLGAIICARAKHEDPPAVTCEE